MYGYGGLLFHGLRLDIQRPPEMITLYFGVPYHDMLYFVRLQMS
jgi:hypothetical protein